MAAGAGAHIEHPPAAQIQGQPFYFGKFVRIAEEIGEGNFVALIVVVHHHVGVAIAAMKGGHGFRVGRPGAQIHTGPSFSY